MSDCVAKRFGKKEEFAILSSQSDLGKSSYHKHSPWMSHWTRASISAEPQCGNSCCPFEEIGDVGYSKDCGTLPFELIKARVAERFMLGVSNAGASAGDTQQFNSKMWGVTHNVCQGVECKNDQVDRSFESSMTQKNVNLYAANAVVSERFSVHKLSDISVNSRKVLSSDNLSSEWNHFPIFEINQKIDGILNPRRSAVGTSPDKPFVPQKALKVKMCASNVMTFSSKEYQFHSHQITDENMNNCRSAVGIQSHEDNHIGLNSDHAGRELKGHLSIEESCSCSKNETNPSCSLTDKRCASVKLKDLSHWANENKFMFSASRKENENIETKKLGPSGGCQKQQDFERVAFHGPVLDREYEMKPVNASAPSKGNAVETGCRANLLQPEENVNTHRVDSAMKLTESCELPDNIENTLTMKSKGETLAAGKPPKVKLTSSKRKPPCLFEMLTLPSKSQATRFKDPTSSGFAATSTQKLTNVPRDSDSPNMAKSEQIAPSSIRGVSSSSRGNETVNLSAENHNSSKATCASEQEWSMSKTASMNLDLVFQIGRMGNPVSSALIESPACSEPSDKWLKRLRHNISDAHFLCSKRPKVGDGPQPGETCTVFGREIDCDTHSANMINHVKEDQLRYGRLMNQQNREGSPISAKSFNRWIGRWCQGGAPTFHGTSNVEKQTPKSNTPPNDLESQFPSIAAMAMMGRVMNKLRPCELQKRGPSVVWKTHGL
ncbi:uncharacterized protein LOC133918280 [Phragmites australis]|uniref:uncharacterized protein LOC133918280 n=1 Tax=Phragmites australis TaxID=29695 RepID=UPI002D78FF9C|nr:uncharacterized protein LOC133918280 [Phragmites australis]XP_062218068.1 uncharacterized protein LOC133918280 [Phragmites australis]